MSPQARLRREHERIILRAISSGTTVSRTELAADHDLSAQSVGRIVRDLLDAGLIEEVGIDQPSGPGAPRIGLRMRPDGAYALGFGLERDRLTGVLLDLGASVRWQLSVPIQPGQAAAEVLGRIEGEVLTVLGQPEFAAYRPRLCGLGVAAPGPIRPRHRHHRRAPELPAVAARRRRPGAEPRARGARSDGQRRDRRGHRHQMAATPGRRSLPLLLLGRRDRRRPGDRRRGLPGHDGQRDGDRPRRRQPGRAAVRLRRDRLPGSRSLRGRDPGRRGPLQRLPQRRRGRRRGAAAPSRWPTSSPGPPRSWPPRC